MLLLAKALFIITVTLLFNASQFIYIARYFTFNKSILSTLLFIIYLSTFFVFMSTPLIDHSLYIGIHVITALLLITFPVFFDTPSVHNPRRYVASPTSFQLMGADGSYLPINAPELGIFLVGTPGCGKTKYVIEPMLSRMIAQGYSGMLYDYDFSNASGANYSLTRLAYNCCARSDRKPKFLNINFQNLAISSRINPIAPQYIQDRKRLSHCLRTFLANLNPKLAQGEDFWQKNTYALLKSLVVFLANKHPVHCSLPHVILLGLQPAEVLKNILYADEEAKLYASPILDALEYAPEQFAGVIANFKVSLERLLDPTLFWVLSGDGVPHVLNDPKNPIVLCLGNTPSENETLSPILAMTIDTLVSNMYSHGRNKSFVVLDELPTIFLPHLNDIPATARKYNIVTVVALQTIAQLEQTYGVVGSRELQETFGNHIVGRSSFRISKEMSDAFGSKTVHTTSQTVSDTHWMGSTTTHTRDRPILDPQQVMTLGVGEFVGRVAERGEGFFKTKLRSIRAYDSSLHHEQLLPLPVVHKNVDIHSNYNTIRKDICNVSSLYKSYV